MAKENKTNVMRLLDGAKISYEEFSYDPSVTDGETIARILGNDPARTFKTLVTVADTGKNFVFVVPVNRELDLKAAARSVGAKSVEMIPQKTLFPLTGYVHGGCSPVGMKKKFQTVFDDSCLESDTMLLSAGKLGRQIRLSPEKIIRFVDATTYPISRSKAKA